MEILELGIAYIQVGGMIYSAFMLVGGVAIFASELVQEFVTYVTKSHGGLSRGETILFKGSLYCTMVGLFLLMILNANYFI